jgi:hypothetical protein
VPERIKEMSPKIFSVQIFVLYLVWYNLKVTVYVSLIVVARMLWKNELVLVE